jgi:hypothetical protein
MVIMGGMDFIFLMEVMVVLVDLLMETIMENLENVSVEVGEQDVGLVILLTQGVTEEMVVVLRHQYRLKRK